MAEEKYEIRRIFQALRANTYCPYLGLLAIFIFQLVLGVYYILADTRVLAWDQSLHLTLALEYAKLLGAGRIFEMIGLSGYYPPLYHLSTMPLYLFGISENISIFVNFIYLAILLFAMYGIGRLMFDKKTGLLAALLISCYPFILMYERDYMLEFALIAIVALSLYFLLKSDNFNNRRYAVLFGVGLACSVLVKEAGFIFLVIPILFSVVKNFTTCAYCRAPSVSLREGLMGFCSKKHQEKYKKSDRKPGAITNIFLAFVIAFVIAGIWYLPNLGSVIHNTSFFAGAGTSQPGMVEQDPGVFSLQSLIFYSTAAYTQLYLLFVILFLIGLVFLIRDKSLREKALFLILSILVPYLVFTLLKNKDPRFTGPLLIFFALISAFWVFKTEKKYQKILVPVIAVLCIVQVAAMTFGAPSVNDTLFPSQSPKDENWMVPDAIAAIQSSLPATPDHPITVVVLPDYPYVNGRTYEYYAELNNSPFVVYNGAYIPLQTFERALPSLDYLVYKEGGAIASGPYDQTVTELYRLFEIQRSRFRSIAEFPLPDHSKLVIFKNIRL